MFDKTPFPFYLFFFLLVERCKCIYSEYSSVTMNDSQVHVKQLSRSAKSLDSCKTFEYM